MQDILDKIEVNENIYVYKKINNKFYSKAAIKSLFKTAKEDKKDQNCVGLHSEIAIGKKTNGGKGGKEYKLSMLFLKYSNNPTFLNTFIDSNWLEQKLAYLIILDFGGFIIVLKRNISGIQEFINSLEEIDYQIISKLLVNDNTLFEKFSTQNLDINKDAIRARSVESDDLRSNYNYLGSNKHTLNILRINNNNQRYVLSLNTSRISKSGEKVGVPNVANWAVELINAIENFVNKESFLDVFATPCNYEKERDTLVPNSLTILLIELINDITTGKIVEVVLDTGTISRKLNLLKFITASNISLEVNYDKQYIYKANDDTKPKFLKNTLVKLNPKSVRIYNKKLTRINLLKDDGTIENLNNYLNRNQSFIINFDDCEYIYSNRSLFRDSNLLGSIETILDVFEIDPSLDLVTSEKGTVTAVSTAFNDDCVFGYVEQKFANEEFLVLDDLGDEWADHIAISKNKVTFIISKFSSAIFSATAFTDIIGQAQKNLGNIFAPDIRLNNKRLHWSNNFNFNKIQTSITRLRKGNSIDDFISKYIDVKRSVNPRRAVCLVLNFMSKQELKNNLDNLRNEVFL